MCQQHFSSILGLRGWRQRAGAEGPPHVFTRDNAPRQKQPRGSRSDTLIRARADEVGHRAEQWPKAARPSRSEGTMTEAVLGRSWHEPAACPQQWRESGTAPPRTWPTATRVRSCQRVERLDEIELCSAAARTM